MDDANITEAQGRVLEVLRSTRVATPLELTDATSNYKARILELRRMGFVIETLANRTGRASYRLVSTGGDVDQTVAGMTLRISSTLGVIARTHRDAHRLGFVPDDVLDKALDAAVQAYRSVVAPHLDLDAQ